MKRYLYTLIIGLLVLGLQAQDKAWTIVKSETHGEAEKNRVGYFWAGPSLKVKLGEVKAGTKVYPIEHREDVYHIRFQDGQIGWVYFTMLRETQEMEIEKPTGLHQIKGSSSFKMGKFIDSLYPGDLVTRYGLSKNGGNYYVINSEGKKGAIIRQHAFPVPEKTIPEYSTNQAKIFLLKKDINEKVLQKSDSNLWAEFGMPEALVYRPTGDVWYYTYIETYDKGLRYRGINFIVKDQMVVGDSLIGEGNWKLIDQLPLFIKVKGMSALDVFDKYEGEPLFKGIGKMHWAVRFLIRILQFIIAFIILSLAHFIALFLTMRLARVQSISNGLLLIIGFALTIILNYVYFIFISAHVIKEEVWFPVILMIIILVLSFRKISTNINYHRCPRCKAMWTAQDEGSVVTGKKHITENKSEQRVTNEYTKSDGGKVREITNFKWKEHMTEKQMKDLRYCQECGFRWGVDRVEKVEGHV